jgi:hypothetical protein
LFNEHGKILTKTETEMPNISESQLLKERQENG